VLIADLKTCDYAEFKALVNAARHLDQDAHAAKVLLNGHNYTFAATKTGSAANLEAVFAKPPKPVETAPGCWIRPPPMATRAAARSPEISAATLVLSAIMRIPPPRPPSFISPTARDENLFRRRSRHRKGVFIAGTTSFADNLSVESDVADRLLLIPFKIPHTAGTSTTTTSGTTSERPIPRQRHNLRKHFRNDFGNDLRNEQHDRNHRHGPQDRRELDRCITVDVLSWLVVNPNADAAQITEAENF
jgi:hypothetical protein